MPLLSPPPPAHSVPGDKRRLLVIVLAVTLVFAAAAIWTALRPGAYEQPGTGCVTVTIPSTTGGTLLHGCGTRARVMCRRAFAGHDRLSLLTRPPCRTAGLH
jgi:hypothetical protein